MAGRLKDGGATHWELWDSQYLGGITRFLIPTMFASFLALKGGSSISEAEAAGIGSSGGRKPLLSIRLETRTQDCYDPPGCKLHVYFNTVQVSAMIQLQQCTTTRHHAATVFKARYTKMAWTNTMTYGQNLRVNPNLYSDLKHSVIELLLNRL